ncbi:hypothetical protein FQR65_LT18970 [Abscondita terminalis]|nr:hypothetical protein FQR65_LT18970 [Abscondita terminalis]
MKKWRNLRDTYVRLKGEYETYVPSGSASKKRKKTWEFYEQMAFLNDTLNYRNTTTNLKLSPSSTSSGDEHKKQRNKPNSTDAAISPSSTSSGDEHKKQRNKPNSTDAAIIDAISRINSTPVEAASKEDVNPVCIRLSQILQMMPQRERFNLEIRLMELAYESAQNYL